MLKIITWLVGGSMAVAVLIGAVTNPLPLLFLFAVLWLISRLINPRT
jgi:hypothetical protein